MKNPGAWSGWAISQSLIQRTADEGDDRADGHNDPQPDWLRPLLADCRPHSRHPITTPRG